jgi:hypothetical protein
MNTLPRSPMPASQAGMNRIYVGMREISASDCIDEGFVSQEARKHHLAAQAAIDGRRVKDAERRERLVAGVGVALFIVWLGALLVANSMHVFR